MQTQENGFQLFSGLEYLKIDIANNFGKDKEIYEDRIGWFNENEHLILDESKFKTEIIDKAEEPPLVYAGIKAYKDALKGISNGYPVAFDAVSSGCQLNSIMTRCEKGMALTGVLNTGKRPSPYLTMTESMAKANILPENVQYSDVKKLIMRVLYGSTATVIEFFHNPDYEEKFYEILEYEIPGAFKLDRIMQGLYNKFVFTFDWVMPDNFHCLTEIKGKLNCLAYTDRLTDKEYFMEVNLIKNESFGKRTSPDTTHSTDAFQLREVVDRCNFNQQHKKYLSQLLIEKVDNRSDTRSKDIQLLECLDHYDNSNFFSVRILKLLDKQNIGWVEHDLVYDMIKTLPNKTFDIRTTHDCFGCLPNNMNRLRMQYNYFIQQLYNSNMSQFLLNQVGKRHVDISRALNPVKKHISDRILGANYAIT